LEVKLYEIKNDDFINLCVLEIRGKQIKQLIEILPNAKYIDDIYCDYYITVQLLLSPGMYNHQTIVKLKEICNSYGCDGDFIENTDRIKTLDEYPKY